MSSHLVYFRPLPRVQPTGDGVADLATVVVYVVVATIPPDLVRVSWGVPLNTNVSVKMYGMTKVMVV